MADLSAIDKAITEIQDFKEEIEKLKAVQTKINEQIEERERFIMAELEKNNLKSFKGNRGTMIITSRFSVKMPKDPGVKEELKDWLMARQMFDGTWTINHQTLNAVFKAELEAATERGEMIDIPGLNPVEDKFLQLRKA